MGCQSDHMLYTTGANGDSIDIMCFQPGKPQVQSGTDKALQTLMWSDIRNDTIELTMWGSTVHTHSCAHIYTHMPDITHTHNRYMHVQYACAVRHRTMWCPSTYGYAALKE